MRCHMSWVWERRVSFFSSWHCRKNVVNNLPKTLRQSRSLPLPLLLLCWRFWPIGPSECRLGCPWHGTAASSVMSEIVEIGGLLKAVHLSLSLCVRLLKVCSWVEELCDVASRKQWQQQFTGSVVNSKYYCDPLPPPSLTSVSLAIFIVVYTFVVCLWPSLFLSACLFLSVQHFAAQGLRAHTPHTHRKLLWVGMRVYVKKIVRQSKSFALMLKPAKPVWWHLKQF